MVETTPPWRLVTPEQFKQGWIEVCGVTPVHHTYRVIGRDEAGNYIVRNPELQVLERPAPAAPLKMDDQYEVRGHFQFGKSVAVASASELVQAIQSVLGTSPMDEVTVRRVRIIAAPAAPQEPT